jgi:hypothetical protein
MASSSIHARGSVPAALAAVALLFGCAGLEGPRETITIDSEPQGARVYVAGREIGVTPLKVVLDETFPRHWTSRAHPEEEAAFSYRRMETVDLKREGCETYTKVLVEQELKDDVRVSLKCDPNYRPPAPATEAQTVEQRLRALEDLRSKGLVTDEEYRAQRQRILNSM